MTTAKETLGNEIANAVTHGIGSILGVAGLVVLIVFADLYGTARHVVAVSVFGATLIMLYLASTLYHSIPGARAKRVLRIIDHASIYLLIAGTYTPFALISLQGAWRWTVFGVVWGLAIAGVTLKAFFTGRFGIVSCVIYLAMGWMSLVLIKPLLGVISPLGIFWLAAGGVAYTVGVLFYTWKSFSYSHALWHLFVMAGSTCHFFAVLLYVLPRG
jgi:hemolysin III